MRIISILAIAALTVACGNNAEQAPPATPNSAPAAPEAQGSAAAGTPHDGHGKHEGGGHEDHGKMKPELHAFHETLAPIWHANPGTDRVAKACGGLGDLGAKAASVNDAELTAAVEGVKSACSAPDKKDVEPKLGAVHDRFHKLAEAK